MRGEIIIKLTSHPYHSYLKESILDPLNIIRTIVIKESGLPNDSSLAYNTLDNGEPYNVPLLGSSASVVIGSMLHPIGGSYTAGPTCLVPSPFEPFN